MRTCSQRNIEENLGRTEAGFHSECQPTDIDAQSTLAFNLENGKKLDRSTEFISSQTADSKADN